MTTVAQTKVKPGRDSADPANPALAALRDHLAAELAREYIHLMEDAVRNHPVLPTAADGEEA